MRSVRVPSLIESLIVAGIVGVVSMLWRINTQLGCIKVEMRYFRRVTEDHEDRIRELEQDD